MAGDRLAAIHLGVCAVGCGRMIEHAGHLHHLGAAPRGVPQVSTYRKHVRVVTGGIQVEAEPVGVVGRSGVEASDLRRWARGEGRPGKSDDHRYRQGRDAIQDGIFGALAQPGLRTRREIDAGRPEGDQRCRGAGAEETSGIEADDMDDERDRRHEPCDPADHEGGLPSDDRVGLRGDASPA